MFDHKTYRNTEILAYARDLALRDYDIVVSADTLTDGTLVYVARTPELGTCKAQGHNIIEAVKNLIDARIDYIYFLLVDMQEVPPPNAKETGKVNYQLDYQQNGTISVSSVAQAITLTPDDIARMMSQDDKFWRPVVGDYPIIPPYTPPYGTAVKNTSSSATYRLPDAGARIEPRERTIIPHVEYYETWGDLWVAILNDDVRDFDILDKTCNIVKRQIRIKDNGWEVWKRHGFNSLFVALVAKSKPELLTLIGYLSRFDLSRVKCLPKKPKSIEADTGDTNRLSAIYASAVIALTSDDTPADNFEPLARILADLHEAHPEFNEVGAYKVRVKTDENQRVLLITKDGKLDVRIEVK